jgi:hypothetical protein
VGAQVPGGDGAVRRPAPDGGQDRRSLSSIPESGLSDSGHRKVFATGARRDRPQGKGRYDLISPVALRELALLLEKGAIKYSDPETGEGGARNWEKGLPLSDLVDAAKRHLNDLLEGDRTENHAVAAMWNCMVLVHEAVMIERGGLPPELDDLPDYTGGTGYVPAPGRKPLDARRAS